MADGKTQKQEDLETDLAFAISDLKDMGFSDEEVLAIVLQTASEVLRCGPVTYGIGLPRGATWRRAT